MITPDLMNSVKRERATALALSDLSLLVHKSVVSMEDSTHHRLFFFMPYPASLLNHNFFFHSDPPAHCTGPEVSNQLVHPGDEVRTEPASTGKNSGQL